MIIYANEIKAASLFMDNKGGSPWLKGVHIENKSGQLKIESTNGVSAFRYQRPADYQDPDFSIIVPSDVVNGVLAMKTVGALTLSGAGKVKNWALRGFDFEPIEGVFPDTDRYFKALDASPEEMVPHAKAQIDFELMKKATQSLALIFGHKISVRYPMRFFDDFAVMHSPGSDYPRVVIKPLRFPKY